MAVTQCMPTAAKLGFLTGVHVPGDTYNIALFLASGATLNNSTGTYTLGMAGELATAGGYTQGGKVLATYASSSSGTTSSGTAWIDWTTDPQWTSASFTADSAVIYNATKSNAIIAILSFGTATATSGTFTIVLPTADATNAIIRIGA